MVGMKGASWNSRMVCNLWNRGVGIDDDGYNSDDIKRIRMAGILKTV